MGAILWVAALETPGLLLRLRRATPLVLLGLAGLQEGLRMLGRRSLLMAPPRRDRPPRLSRRFCLTTRLQTATT